ncbi:MAG: PAC2 family protein [Candidatus Micrarchaeota archaeon]
MTLTFSQSHVLVNKAIKPKNPVLIVGLPGIGFVSKLAADHLVKSSGAEHFATLYSPNLPNQVVAMKSGSLRPFCMRFYYKKFKSRDVVILKGDMQPLTVEGQYEVTAKILRFFQQLGGHEVIAMAGYALNKQNDKPNVFCAATSKEYMHQFLELGAKQNDAIVPIVGMAGLVPAMARLYKMKGTCLLVETPGQNIDATGAGTLVELLARMLHEKIDVSPLRGQARKAEEVMRRIEAQAKQEEGRAVAMPEAGARRETLSYIH